jgi:hypothetical protein
MPFSTPEKKRAGNKAWRDRKMAEGYGKALYARRAQRFRNEEILRKAAVRALELIEMNDTKTASHVLMGALFDAPPVTEPLDYMPRSPTENGEE